MTINTKVAKILSAGKILTAGLLGMNNTAQAVPYGDVHTYPTDNWDRSTGNSIIWHPQNDNSLTLSLYGTADTGFTQVLDDLDLSGFTDQKIQFFMIYTNLYTRYDGSTYPYIRMSEVDNICVSDIYIKCTGS